MNTLTGYSKNKLSDNYLLTAAGGHLAAGVENGSAAIYVSWPTYSKLKELNYIDANYGTGDYGHPDEEFLKGICKWAIANYSGSSCTLLGAIAPNSSGTCCMHLYGNSGFDATTKLPRYCMGWYQTLGGQLRYFGTSDYIWKYSEYARKADIKNPVNYYWANVPISDKSSTTTSPTVNTITANNYVTFGAYGALFTSDIRDSWRTSIYGDTTNQSRLRTVRTDVTIADFSEIYGSGLAWASGDTQGYLSVSHASGKAWIGGGNSNKLNWSTELITGKNIANQSVKQATTATKWATARAITLDGLLQGSVSLDGSLNVTLASYNYHCIAGSSATNNYPYHLIMKCDPITGQWVDLFGLYRITQGYKGGNIGVFYVVVRTNSGTTASTCEIGWIYRKGFAVDAIQAGFYDVLGNTYIDVFCKTNSTYIKNTIEQISITKNRGEIGRGFTLQSSSESSTLLSDKSYITNTSKTTSYSTIASGLTNAAGGNALRTYTSIISATDSEAHIYLATRLVTARNFLVNLSSTSAAAFSGIANCTPGVTGTLAVANGGTGRSTLTAGSALVGNGTGAVSLRSITASATKDSTSLITSGGVYTALSSYLPLAGGIMAGHLSSNSGYTLIQPIGAQYNTTESSKTGCITINLPASVGNTMCSMWIDVYVYSKEKSFTVHCGGYTYNNSTWTNSPFAVVYGAEHRVRLGHNGTNFVIYIGEETTTWAYPQIQVRNVTLGYYPTLANWQKSWSVGFSTSVSNVTYDTITYAWTTKNLTKSSIGLGNVANYDQSKAIKSITRSGTTFTYTCLDGTTGTFTQLDTTIPNISITNSGSGNAVTSITASGHTLTVTKGSTFATSNHTHDDYFKFRGWVPSNNANANDYINLGTYLNGTGNGSGNSNFPTTYGYLNTFGNGGSYDYCGWQLYVSSGGVLQHRLYWSGWTAWRTALDSINYTNYVNTTNFPGLNKTGTVTSVTVTGANGLSGTGTVTTSGTITLSNAGVRSTTINGNYLRVNTNGTNADLTIPYASVAGKLSIGSYDKSSEIDFTKVFWTANSNDGDSVTGFGYAAVMNVGSNLHRGWQVWNSRNDHTLYWRPAKSDASAWADVHAILDSANYTSYTVKKDGTGASGTWGINISGSAASAGHLKVVSCHNGTTNNDLWSTIKSSNSAYLGTSTMYEVYNDGGPTTYGHVLDTVTVHTNHWLSLLWMASGKDGKIYYRNKDYNDNSWGGWKTVAWTSEIPTVTNYYWANINISASSNEATKPTFDLVRIISDSYPGLLVKRSNSANSAIIALANSNGVLGGLGMTGSANGGLRRYLHDYSSSYLMFDGGNSSVSGGGSSWGSSITVNLGGTTKTLTIPSAPTNISGNAGTATTLQTARTISLSTGVVATPTSFNGSANISIPVTEIKESYLTWGGKNLSGTVGPVDAALVPMLGANRFAFMPADAITIEVSTNGGSSWSTYPSVSDSHKIGLFNGGGTELHLGGSTDKLIDKSNYKLRITIDTITAKVYTALYKFLILISTLGSLGCYCTITTRTQADYAAGTDSWTTQAENVTLSGWSGWNVINTSFTTAGSSDNTTHQRQIRFTFGCTSHNSTVNYSGLRVMKIVGIGGVGWTTPSTLASTGNIYDYDYELNVSFPGSIYPKTTNTKTLGSSTRKWSNVYATTFTGNLTGNVTGNVSGSSGSCTGNAATASKLGTDTKGSTSKPIYLNAGTPTECSTYAGGTAVTLNGSSKAGSTASFYAPTSVGANGLMLISSGSGAPTWLNINLGYIGRTAVLANAAALSLTGIGNITPETTKTYTLGTTSVRWKSAYINDINISQSGTETISRIFEDVGTTGGFYLNTSSAWGFTIQHKKSNTNYAITFATTTFAPAPITSETSTTYINLGSSSKPWGDIYGTYKGCLRSPAIIWCGYLNRAYSSTIWSAVKEGGLATLTFSISDASINGSLKVIFTGYRVLGAFCNTRSLHDGGQYFADENSITGRSGGMGDYMTYCVGTELSIRKFKQQNENNDLWNNDDLATTSTEYGNKPVTSFYLVVVGY